jgi:hypothetical protein
MNNSVTNTTNNGLRLEIVYTNSDVTIGRQLYFDLRFGSSSGKLMYIFYNLNVETSIILPDDVGSKYG